jgi:predicted RNase H-like HicB family nuclease
VAIQPKLELRFPTLTLLQLTFSRIQPILKDMKFRLMLEKDEKLGRWSAVFPELPGCGSAGDTEEEAVENAKEALALWFEPAEVTIPADAKLIEVALP